MSFPAIDLLRADVALSSLDQTHLRPFNTGCRNGTEVIVTVVGRMPSTSARTVMAPAWGCDWISTGAMPNLLRLGLASIDASPITVSGPVTLS